MTDIDLDPCWRCRTGGRSCIIGNPVDNTGIVGGNSAYIRPISPIIVGGSSAYICPKCNPTKDNTCVIVGGNCAELETTSLTSCIMGGDTAELDLGPGIYGLKHRDGKPPIYLFRHKHEFSCPGCKTLATYLQELQNDVE